MKPQTDARTLYGHFYRARRCHMPLEILNLSSARNSNIYLNACLSSNHHMLTDTGWINLNRKVEFAEKKYQWKWGELPL